MYLPSDANNNKKPQPLRGTLRVAARATARHEHSGSCPKIGKGASSRQLTARSCLIWYSWFSVGVVVSMSSASANVDREGSPVFSGEDEPEEDKSDASESDHDAAVDESVLLEHIKALDDEMHAILTAVVKGSTKETPQNINARLREHYLERATRKYPSLFLCLP